MENTDKNIQPAFWVQQLLKIVEEVENEKRIKTERRNLKNDK